MSLESKGRKRPPMPRFPQDNKALFIRRLKDNDGLHNPLKWDQPPSKPTPIHYSLLVHLTTEQVIPRSWSATRSTIGYMHWNTSNSCPEVGLVAFGWFWLVLVSCLYEKWQVYVGEMRVWTEFQVMLRLRISPS